MKEMFDRIPDPGRSFETIFKSIAPTTASIAKYQKILCYQLNWTALNSFRIS